MINSSEPYAEYGPRRSRPRFGPVVVPKKNDQVEIRADKRLYINGEPVDIPKGTYSQGMFRPNDHGPPLSGFQTFYGSLFPKGTTLDRPTEPITVDQDYYFTLGDNRDNSKDSRYWGFVKSDRIKGKAFFIYWSWNRRARHLAQHVRWDRLGQLLGLRPSGQVLLRE